MPLMFVVFALFDSFRSLRLSSKSHSSMEDNYCTLLNFSIRAWPVLLTVYLTVTSSCDSCVRTSTDLTVIRSPSHICSALWTRIWVAVTSSSLKGAKTSWFSPVPNVGRLTLSPGMVNSTCSIICLIWSLSLACSLRPFLSTWKGKANCT